MFGSRSAKKCAVCGSKKNVSDNNLCENCQSIYNPLFQRDVDVVNESLDIIRSSTNKFTIISRGQVIVYDAAFHIQQAYLDVGIDPLVDLFQLKDYTRKLVAFRFSELGEDMPEW